MAMQTELERYEEWRSTFTLSEEGPHTFRQLDKLRRIDNIAWGSGTDEEKIVEISAVLSE
ncbi:hypothetical protein SEA_PLATTE_72 [Microbacterium phage Platte]|nr:hypothetical protein SEA_HORTUS1_72 [Microbacterium phage Hortus1]AWY05642.1 hypothetical protein SEA_OLINDD_72 [Microbacterium phage OlinDD]AWY05895.1 hypothetical protein SEA_PIONEER3_72 [Microbacterium phage Pioneer3]QZD97664.1 hypothetical protein SEA_PLATTE_72 [Microbacterium phage Platte]